MSRRSALGALAVGGAAGAGRQTLQVADVEPDTGRDVTAALEKALASGAGKEVYLRGGRYIVSGGRLRIPSGTTLRGAGRGTVIQRAGNGILLDASGPASMNQSHGIALRDMVLDGGAAQGLLLRLYYVNDFYCDNVWFRNNPDLTVDTTEFWDSKFENCTWDWCSGNDGHSPAVLLRNAAAASGFGASGDNTNAITFLNCRWESFLDGALWLMRGEGHAVLSQISIVNAKMETSFAKGPFLRVGRTVQNVRVENIYLAVNTLAPGARYLETMVDFSGFGQCSIVNASVWLGAATVGSCIRVSAGHASNMLSEIWVDGPRRPVEAVVAQMPGPRILIGRYGFLHEPGVADDLHQGSIGR